jgi:hypothetical protein
MNHADARKKTMAKPSNRISICSSSQMAERYQKPRKNGVKNQALTGHQATFRVVLFPRMS